MTPTPYNCLLYTNDRIRSWVTTASAATIWECQLAYNSSQVTYGYASAYMTGVWNIADADNSALANHVTESEQQVLRQIHRPLDEYDRVIRAERERTQNANNRALSLLRSVLSPEQRHEFADRGYFHVDSPSGRRYRITQNWAGNVYLIEHNQTVRKFCIHPTRTVPTPDSMIAQKFMLETDEARFLRIANHSRWSEHDEWVSCPRNIDLTVRPIRAAA